LPGKSGSLSAADGIALLELSKKAYFCTNSKIQAKSESCSIRVFELNMEGSRSYRDVSQPFDLLCDYEHDFAKKKPPELFPAAFQIVTPQVGLEPTNPLGNTPGEQASVQTKR